MYNNAFFLRFGANCAFAHGIAELRPKTNSHVSGSGYFIQLHNYYIVQIPNL